MKVVSIIQARMGSTRFPQKMVADLGGYPVMEWVLYRSSLAENVDETILALPNSNENKELEKIARRYDIFTYYGDEEDVLKRYVKGVKKTDADIVVRICGDRPLVDPKLIDQCISFMLKRGLDYSFNHVSWKKENWPRGFGVEVAKSEFLIGIDKKILTPEEREHVTLAFWRRNNNMKISVMPCAKQYKTSYEDVKLDLDTVSDYNRLKKVVDGLGIDTPGFLFLKKALHDFVWVRF